MQIPKHVCCEASQTFSMVYVTKPSALPVPSSEIKVLHLHCFVLGGSEILEYGIYHGFLNALYDSPSNPN